MTTFTAGQMTALAEKAGFDKKTAKIMGAIGMAESTGNSNAHNTNAATGDNSYGLWQINMLGDMGPSRRKSLQINKNEDLFVPAINAMAAYKIYKSQGLNAWSTYKNGDYKDHLSKADADAATLEELNKNPIESSPIGDIASLIADNPISNIAEAVMKAAAWMSNPSNWVRVVYVAGGGVVIIAGVVYLAKDTAIQGVAGSALKTVKSGTQSIKKVKKVT